MSWLPLYNSWLICFVLISLFYWKLGVLFIVLGIFLVSFYFLILESKGWGLHFPMGFWLFIGSEIIIFFTLFFLVFYNEVESTLAISNYIELPFLGTFLLIGSSITVTCFHHCIGVKYDWVPLFITLFLGFLFVVLQLFEFYDCGCDLLMDSFYCSSFCTVGLHFSHVVVGLFLLASVLILLPRGLSSFYGDLGVWYWHFVDYIWLVVFFVVYCSSF